MANVTQSYLTPNEKKILKALGELGSPRYPQQLAKYSGLSVEVTVQSALLLQDKGLVKIIEDIDTNYKLTNEGNDYANNDLPERRFIEYINKLDEIPTFNELKDKFGPEFGIALGQSRKKEWVQIGEGKVYSNGLQDSGKDEELLLQIQADNDIELLLQIESYQQAIKNLIKRNLIEKSEDKTIKIEITESALDIFNLGIAIEEDIAQLTSDLIRTGEWKQKYLRPYNINTPVQPVYGGKTHPYQRLIDEMRQIFLEMGFTEIKGEIIQSSFWNFDALFQPQDHPARDMQDTFYLDSTGDVPPRIH